MAPKAPPKMGAASPASLASFPATLSPSLISSCLTGQVCSCLRAFGVAVPSAWNTLVSDLHRVGSLCVSFNPLCKCEPSPASLSKTLAPLTLGLGLSIHFTLLYFSSKHLSLLYIIQYASLLIWLLSVFTM